MLYRTKMFWFWPQCAARGGENFVHLTGMICPWAGNLTANFWKMPNQVIQVKQANLGTSLLSRSLCKVIKAHFVHFRELRRGRLVARPHEYYDTQASSVVTWSLVLSFTQHFYDCVTKQGWKLFFFNFFQHHKREKFGIPWIFYVLNVNFFIAQGADAL